MSYRDETESLRARVEALEGELGRARETIARLEGGPPESAWKKAEASHDAVHERVLPFELEDRAYEAIAEALKARFPQPTPQTAQVAQVGKTLTFRAPPSEIVVARGAAPGTTAVRATLGRPKRWVEVLLVVWMSAFAGLFAAALILFNLGFHPSSITVGGPVGMAIFFALFRWLNARAWRKRRMKLGAAVEAVAQVAGKHAVRREGPRRIAARNDDAAAARRESEAEAEAHEALEAEGAPIEQAERLPLR